MIGETASGRYTSDTGIPGIFSALILIPSSLVLYPGKMAAKELFANHEYNAAEQAFLLLAADDQGHELDFCAVQLSNAAQCAISLREYGRAADHAHAGIKIHPYNPKAHYRLATALSKLPFPKQPVDAARRSCDIALANAGAQALISTSANSRPRSNR